ncbi:MAG: hypothetical protein F4206_02735 [Gammaproteobacteria bacterium]|nr:hypothetical protein [Gammaproteobacteria bacterium]MYG65635.1 hypothetical protein [Gammaproteobacteria bacterium]
MTPEALGRALLKAALKRPLQVRRGPAGVSLYQAVWDRVHLAYLSGDIANGRTLQCVLYQELMHEFPNARILAEPCCNGQHPGLAMADDSKITDIFELEYRPGDSAGYECAIGRLASCVGDRTRSCPVSTGPGTGCGRESNAPPLAVPEDCRLHFVAVSRWKSDALNTRAVADCLDIGFRPPLYHWKGPGEATANWEVDCIPG